MLKFNNNHIFTGYIKQLLSSYYLTKYRVYNTDMPVIPSTDALKTEDYQIDRQDIWYIKDAQIQQYKNNTWKNIQPTLIKSEYLPDHHQWIENRLDLNHVRKFQIKNTIYDSYTHEYLGDFLRFIRDYHKLDLMRLYNCFSNRLVDELNIKVPSKYDSQTSIGDFSTNAQYKIYAIPVKLFHKYTLAIDCPQSVQVCCTIWNGYVKNILDAGKNTDPSNKGIQLLINTMRAASYKKFSNCKFAQPIIYTGLNFTDVQKEHYLNALVTQSAGLIPYGDGDTAQERWMTGLDNLYNSLLGYMAANQSDLYLLLKIPATNTSSITILQGDYTSFNNYVPTLRGNKLVNQVNYSGLANVEVNVFAEENFISPCQLLKLNTGISYPFANRLMQYLLGQTITELQTIGDNVKRVQAVVDLPANLTHLTGIWTPHLRNTLYQFMTYSQANRTSASNTDSMGWADKDVQAAYYNQRIKNDKVILARQLLSCNIYEPDFDDSIQEVR